MILGWHFVGETLRDGRPVPADGEWLVHEGPIVPAGVDLSAFVRPFDALWHSTGGCTLCRVELDGEIVSEIVGYNNPINKYVGRRQRIVARIDATHLLRRFAADQSLSVANLWDMPAVAREYLETLDEPKRDAAGVAAAASYNGFLRAKNIWAPASVAYGSTVDDVRCAACWTTIRSVCAIASLRHPAMVNEVVAQKEFSLARDEFARRVDLAFGIVGQSV